MLLPLLLLLLLIFDKLPLLARGQHADDLIANGAAAGKIVTVAKLAQGRKHVALKMMHATRCCC